MSLHRAVVRALAFSGAIVGIVLAARLALATLPLSRAAALATDALASSLVLAIASVAIASVAGVPVATRLGLHAGTFGARQIAAGVVAVLSLSHAAETALRWLHVASPALARFDDALGGVDPGGAIYPLLVLSLASACGEEIFFRGLLQRGLVRRLGAPAAIAVASVAFGAAHGDWIHGGAAALLGVFLGAIAHGAGSIRPAITAHAVNNAVALLEKLCQIEWPEGPVATPVNLAIALTLACVSLRSATRKTAASPLQLPEVAADDASRTGCAGG